MSFGASPSDIIIVVTFARRLYRQCKNAGGEYLEISREVRGLHTVLKHLKFEVEAPESSLNRDHSVYARELAPVIGDCDYTLRQLDSLIQKYGRLNDSKSGGAERLWDKIRFGSAEMDQLGDIRMKLINHKTSISVLLDTVQLHESSRMSQALDNHAGQLDIILDKVDNIAARMGQRSGSIMTTYDDDDKEVWKQFRRELVAEGFSSDVLQQHKDILRAYIRQMDQDGLLVDMPPEPQARPPPGVNPEKWLETLQSPASEQGAPPSFDSLQHNSEDTMAKERFISEENMKFPQSMKAERPKPDSAPASPADSDEAVNRQLAVPRSDKDDPHRDRAGDIKNTDLSPVPKLVTSLSSPRSKPLIPEYQELPPTPPKTIISTSDLMLYTGGINATVPPSDRRTRPDNSDTLYSPSSSPTQPRDSASFNEDDVVTRSMAFRPKNDQLAPGRAQYGTSPSSQYGTSPSQYGTSPSRIRDPQPPPSPRTTPSDTSFRGVSKLGPDSQGRPIPPDAKWTQIRRSLISTELLDQEKRRYEARSDFVAILGVLTRDEIADLAARSFELRSSRRRPIPIQPPRQPPRPQDRRQPSAPSSDEEESLYDSSDAEPDHRRHHVGNESPLRRSGGSNLQPPYPMYPQQQMPNPYTAGPVFTPGSAAPQSRPSLAPPPHEERRRRRSAPDRRSEIPSNSGLERKSSRDGRGNRNHTERAPLPERVQGRRRWGENLTAAGIGGAAVSLFSVLSEAAEGL